MMKAVHALALLTATTFFVPPSALHGGEAPSRRASRGQASTNLTRTAVLYKPPRLDAPRITTGPATRGDGSAGSVCVLAPDHTAFTTQQQPKLHWLQTGSGTSPLEMALVQPGHAEPIFQQNCAAVPSGQLQTIDLKKHGVILQPGIDYRWSVAVVVDARRRSRDIVSEGAIRCTSPSPVLSQRLRSADSDALPWIYASEGIWYDAVASAMDSMARKPEDEELREKSARLVAEIGLTNVAALCRNGSLLR